MALVHFYLQHHTRGERNGGGGRAVRYLERTDEFAPDAARVVGYNERTSARTKDYDDLRHREVVTLPSWAQDNPQQFFETAYLQEGANRRWATSMQANFPRQFTHEQQVDVTRAFVATHLPERPTLWVIHEPMASDQGTNPHAHFLWSERLQRAGEPERGPEVMFRRPEAGGCWKYSFGESDRQALYRMREAWCATMNDLVDRAGYGTEALMDPRSFQARGITRLAVRERSDPAAPDRLEVLPPLDERTPHDRITEQQMAQQWWCDYKRTMGITPEMDQHAVLAIVAEEVRHPGTRTRQLAQEQMLAPAPTVEASVDHPLIGNVRSKIYHAPGDPSYGEVQPRNQVLFASRALAEQAGYRAACNQHYGPGGDKRLEVQARALAVQVQQYEQHATRVHIELVRERHYEQTTARRTPEAAQALQHVLAAGHALGLDDGVGRGLQVRLRRKAHERGLDIGRA